MSPIRARGGGLYRGLQKTRVTIVTDRVKSHDCYGGRQMGSEKMYRHNSDLEDLLARRASQIFAKTVESNILVRELAPARSWDQNAGRVGNEGLG